MTNISKNYDRLKGGEIEKYGLLNQTFCANYYLYYFKM